jgi:hypothetical protein
LGIEFYSLFEYCLRAEMSLRCRQRFPGKERCLLDHLSPFGTSAVCPSELRYVLIMSSRVITADLKCTIACLLLRAYKHNNKSAR